jgi:hypothetical protein
VLIEWRSSLFDGGLSKIGLTLMEFLKVDKIKKCTEKCAVLHRKMCNEFENV